jgi:stearoyl-CoA desaturase (delta-9 desaturase)
MAFLTFGEGYHNFHHKFQWDYRNGIKWYNFDPSKWIIKLLSIFKVAYGLRKVPDYLILKAKIDTLNKKIKNLSSYMNFSNIKCRDKIAQITQSASINLSLWKSLEKKYSLIKKNNVKGQYIAYQNKRRFYKLELQKSISSLLLIFINLKNVV